MIGKLMNENDRIKVLIVDDHRVVRKGLKAYIEATNDIEVISELNRGETVLEFCEKLKPDVILMDIVMPGLDGLTVTRAIREKYTDIHVVTITGFQTHLLIRAALEAGATSCLSKDASPEDVIQTIRAAKMGLTTLGSDALNIVLEKNYSSEVDDINLHASRLVRELRNVLLQADYEEDSAVRDASDHKMQPAARENDAEPVQDITQFNALTQREQQIVKLVLMGYTSEEIAHCLKRSPRTVQKHRANLMKKLGVHNQIELTRLAYELGIIPSEAEGDQITAEVSKSLGKQS